MGALILVGVLFLVFIIMLIIGCISDKEVLIGIGASMGLISGVALFFMWISTLTLKEDWNKFQYDYEAMKGVIETQRMDEISPLERIQLVDKIMEYNTKISSHKAYNDNYWIGMWYSKEIGELEYIK